MKPYKSPLPILYFVQEEWCGIEIPKVVAKKCFNGLPKK